MFRSRLVEYCDETKALEKRSDCRKYPYISYRRNKQLGRLNRASRDTLYKEQAKGVDVRGPEAKRSLHIEAVKYMDQIL